MAKIPHKHTEPVVQAIAYVVYIRKDVGDANLGLAAGFVFLHIKQLNQLVNQIIYNFTGGSIIK